MKNSSDEAKVSTLVHTFSWSNCCCYKGTKGKTVHSQAKAKTMQKLSFGHDRRKCTKVCTDAYETHNYDHVGAPNYVENVNLNLIGSSDGLLQSDSQHGCNKELMDSNWFQIIPPGQALMWACNPSLIQSHVQNTSLLGDEKYSACLEKSLVIKFQILLASKCSWVCKPEISIQTEAFDSDIRALDAGDQILKSSY
ncbi:uncharacterized protein LOC113772505 isoform X1 [Coffea eugenioides]|uniref:uncharacterized protein LOC113763909 isoform X1 n=1 Tax=Coffea eugenioides TaxID=49369 RepID=UPI000F614955|nr:uncharacterized protein LOC113763909 isoform X1 [Coffea eugenioides]XP_027172917.1 uncharacterized protein LOC113772505 isoform X1 [Coffea eugenioides]